MNTETAQGFFLWCTIINYAILLLWVGVFVAAHDWHYRLTKRWFRISVEQYDLVNFGGVALFKIAVLFLNLVPYVALRLAAR